MGSKNTWAFFERGTMDVHFKCWLVPQNGHSFGLFAEFLDSDVSSLPVSVAVSFSVRYNI